MADLAGRSRLPDYGSLLPTEAIAPGELPGRECSDVPWRLRGTRRVVLGAALLLSCLALAVTEWSTPALEGGAPMSLATEASLRLKVWNAYSERLGPIGTAYPWLPEGGVVVDALAAASVGVSDDAEGCSYELSYDNQKVATESSSLASRDSSWSVVFPAVGRYEGRARAVGCDRGGAPRSVSRVIYALRVRREVRELAAADRERLLDAMAVLWRTRGAAGRATYGDEFVSASEFQVWHHVNSAQRDADHFHQGAGFFAQHARITLQFEAALRSVDAGLTVPYWDCTIESSQVRSGALESLFGTSLWSPLWWGSINFVADGVYLDGADLRRAAKKYAIPDGRFALTRVTGVEDDLSEGIYVGSLSNSYGLVRAPWNNNPSPYVSRYASLTAAQDASSFPDCEIHYNATVAPYPLAQWMWYLQLGPHALMHQTLGGVLYSTPGAAAATTVDLFNALTGRSETVDTLPHTIKQHTLWRLRVLDFPSECGDSSPERCAPACRTDLWSLAQIGRQIILSQDVDDVQTTETFADNFQYFDLSVQAALEKFAAQANDADDDALAALGEAYCEAPGVIISGDQKDSSGTLDPAFWTIHPTMERLYQLRLLTRVGFANEDWPDTASCSGARSDVATPDRPDYIFGFDLISNDDHLVLGTPTSICMGHHADSRMYCGNPDREPSTLQDDVFLQHIYCGDVDKKEDPDLISAAVSKLGRTNEEVLDLLDPRVDVADNDFEYPVYHHFRWDHCGSLGVHFPRVDAPFDDDVAAARGVKADPAPSDAAARPLRRWPLSSLA